MLYTRSYSDLDDLCACVNNNFPGRIYVTRTEFNISVNLADLIIPSHTTPHVVVSKDHFGANDAVEWWVISDISVPLSYWDIE